MSHLYSTRSTRLLPRVVRSRNRQRDPIRARNWLWISIGLGVAAILTTSIMLIWAFYAALGRTAWLLIRWCWAMDRHERFWSAR